MELTKDEVQTLLVLIDVCQQHHACRECGTKAHCDSVWKKLAGTNNLMGGRNENRVQAKG